MDKELVEENLESPKLDEIDGAENRKENRKEKVEEENVTFESKEEKMDVEEESREETEDLGEENCDGEKEVSPVVDIIEEKNAETNGQTEIDSIEP